MPQYTTKDLRSLVREHLPGLRHLEKWTLSYSTRLTRSGGLCDFGKREIRLAKWLLRAGNEDEHRDTFLHEVAHILAGPDGDHGPTWKAWALEVGARPEMLFNTDGLDVPQPKLLVRCRSCETVIGKRFKRDRRLIRRYRSSCCRSNLYYSRR